MTPQEFEWQQGKLEDEYRGGKISSKKFREGMRVLGFGDNSIDEVLTEIELRKMALGK